MNEVTLIEVCDRKQSRVTKPDFPSQGRMIWVRIDQMVMEKAVKLYMQQEKNEKLAPDHDEAHMEWTRSELEILITVEAKCSF